MKDWFIYRDEDISALKSDEDKKHWIDYWNEKYYRNGFVDGSQLVMGCFDK